MSKRGKNTKAGKVQTNIIEQHNTDEEISQVTAHW